MRSAISYCLKEEVFSLKSMRYIFLLTLAWPLLGSAAIYKWLDTQGITHLTDQYQVGAEPILIGDSNCAPPVKSMSVVDVKIPTKNIYYNVCAITSPKVQENIYNNTGAINVIIEYKQALKSGDKVNLFLDGKLFKSEKKMMFQLQNIDRGQHILEAKIVNDFTAATMTCGQVTFYLHRAIINAN